MRYSKIVEGKFLERPNRFIAHCLIDGTLEKCHVKNTGRCKELLLENATVYLEDFRENMGTRKLKFSLISVEKKREKDRILINMDSQAPNKVVKEALEWGKLKPEGMGELTFIRPEKTFGDSRFDFYIEDEEGRKGFIEVKGVTLEEGGRCRFPDAPTERGRKHLKELIRAKKEGYEAYIFFVVQMTGMKEVGPNDRTDPEFGEILREAYSQGVRVGGFQCEVSKNSLELSERLPINLTYEI